MIFHHLKKGGGVHTIIEREDAPKAKIACQVCGQDATTIEVIFRNLTDKTLPIEQCEQVLNYYCDKHRKESK